MIDDPQFYVTLLSLIFIIIVFLKHRVLIGIGISFQKSYLFVYIMSLLLGLISFVIGVYMNLRFPFPFFLNVKRRRIAPGEIWWDQTLLLLGLFLSASFIVFLILNKKVVNANRSEIQQKKQKILLKNNGKITETLSRQEVLSTRSQQEVSSIRSQTSANETKTQQIIIKHKTGGCLGCLVIILILFVGLPVIAFLFKISFLLAIFAAIKDALGI